MSWCSERAKARHCMEKKNIYKQQNPHPMCKPTSLAPLPALVEIGSACSHHSLVLSATHRISSIHCFSNGRGGAGHSLLSPNDSSCASSHQALRGFHSSKSQNLCDARDAPSKAQTGHCEQGQSSADVLAWQGMRASAPRSWQILRQTLTLTTLGRWNLCRQFVSLWVHVSWPFRLPAQPHGALLTVT